MARLFSFLALSSAVFGLLAGACNSATSGGPTDAASIDSLQVNTVDSSVNTVDGSPGADSSSPSVDAGVEANQASDDAAAEASSVEGGGCSIVLASNYDQSCDADTDCVLVGEVPQCPATGCDDCTTKAINQVDIPRYQVALSHAFASVPAGMLFCGCPCTGIAICRSTKCQAGGCVPPRDDALPVCADAGGSCSYATNSTCSRMGPPDACAYADEICCLP